MPVTGGEKAEELGLGHQQNGECVRTQNTHWHAPPPKKKGGHGVHTSILHFSSSLRILRISVRILRIFLRILRISLRILRISLRILLISLHSPRGKSKMSKL